MTTNSKRRLFLQGSVAAGTLGAAVGAGLLAPKSVMAAAWPEAGFKAKAVPAALQGTYGADSTSASTDINIKAPDIAENGAVVPITVETGMAEVDSIAILAEKNPSPLAAVFGLGAGTTGFVSCRIKMGQTSDIIAVVKSGGKLHAARKGVKVTIGGCGG